MSRQGQRPDKPSQGHLESTPLEGTDQFVEEPTFWGDRNGRHQMRSDNLDDGVFDRIMIGLKRLLGAPVGNRRPSAPRQAST
jgi:hypothetical protein